MIKVDPNRTIFNAWIIPSKPFLPVFGDNKNSAGCYRDWVKPRKGGGVFGLLWRRLYSHWVLCGLKQFCVFFIGQCCQKTNNIVAGKETIQIARNKVSGVFFITRRLWKSLVLQLELKHLEYSDTVDYCKSTYPDLGIQNTGGECINMAFG